MLPAAVLAFAERGPEWASFVDRLPRLVRDVSREWELTGDGPALHGHTALVLPVVAPTMLHNAMSELKDHPADGPSRPDPDCLTMCVTLAKAVQN